METETWNNFLWPDWVPMEIRAEIERHWKESWGRGPADWHKSAIYNQSPLFGARVRVRELPGRNLITGRFIFAWNNIGRVIDDDGKIQYVCFQPFEISRNGMWQKPESSDYAHEAEVLPFYGRSQ